jgi:hypothetical protein
MVIFITHKFNDRFFDDLHFHWAFFVEWLCVLGSLLSCILMMIDFHFLIHAKKTPPSNVDASAGPPRTYDTIMNALNAAAKETATQ